MGLRAQASCLPFASGARQTTRTGGLLAMTCYPRHVSERRFTRSRQAGTAVQ